MQHENVVFAARVSNEPTRLQRDVVARIIEMVKSQELPRGTALTELSVARDLRVSRTPARAALSWLAAQGLVKKKPGEGFLTVRSPAQFAVANLEVPVADADQLFVAIARERNAGQLPPDVSEADLMRRFEVTRPTLLKVLARLSEVGMVERRAGHGWRFVPNDHDDDAQLESYRFRMLVEPAALLEPTFSLAPHWLDDMRQRHLAMLKRRWTDADAIGLFEMNADFHEGLCAASGNRFFQMAMEQQNRLRRFVNYDWSHGRERIEASCAEHLEIIDRLGGGDREIASALMRRHLEKASKVGDLP